MVNKGSCSLKYTFQDLMEQISRFLQSAVALMSAVPDKSMGKL